MYKYKSPASRSTTARAFVFLVKFIIQKYLKQEVNDDLSICLDERSPMWPFYNWIYKDLSMSRYQKVMTLLPSMEMCPVDFYQGVVFTAQI